jgi:hypothetical protein
VLKEEEIGKKNSGDYTKTLVRKSDEEEHNAKERSG